ncbi:MAG: hypothetical protein JWN14_360, partial [Chthonomonadales bacterium]|nr:hypothetical protein [Chthonomonadales bacterium]
MRKIFVTAGVLLFGMASAATAQDTNRYDSAFQSAVAVWHMKDWK